jgi:ABC-type multidrug transport system ATPase subunit
VDNLHFYAALRGIMGEKNEEWVMFILDRLGLMKYKDATWKQISGGFRTRFSLARALVQKPNLLVLDEPLANLDINTQLVFLDDLRELVKTMDQPVTMVISSQHLHEIENISDGIIFIRDGVTVYNGPMAEFEADRQENAFELTCDLSNEQVETILKEVGLLGLKMAGENYILRFPREVESETVLRAMLDTGVRILLFRDISQSTRKLFRVEDKDVC